MGRHKGGPGVATVVAARSGDRAAIDALVADHLPLVYNIVGHALHGHADVDDVTQEVMVRVVRGLHQLRDPASFRSWLVAVTVRQVRDHQRESRPAQWSVDERDAVESDFTDRAVNALETDDERRLAAEATRWLDDDDRELLALWWMETVGRLDRDDLVAALGVPRTHVAVRVHRMRQQWDTARRIVRVLHTKPQCPELMMTAVGWDGRPSPLWRKRLARHIRQCGYCATNSDALVPLESLLIGIRLVAVPAALLGWSKQLNLAAPPVKSGVAHAIRVLRWRPRLGLTLTTVGATSAAVAAGVALTPTPPARPSVAAAPQVTRSATPTPEPTTPKPSPKPAVPPPTHRPAPQASKKGVSIWSFSGLSAALKDSGATWFYNWASSDPGTSAPAGVQFVPMIWGGKSVTTSALNTVRAAGGTVLGFNEPDRSDQANMTPRQALDLWPKLEATGARLGSPAVSANAATPGGWLDQFMTGARARGYRVDFIAVHWYGGDFTTSSAVSELRSYLQATYDRYHLPIWLTEYALIDFGGSPQFPSDGTQAAFVTASTQMLDSLAYVERYAWFALPADPAKASTGLYLPGAVPTKEGIAFQAAE